MADQGAGGAYEISSRMTALIGWAATVDSTEQWVHSRAITLIPLVCLNHLYIPLPPIPPLFSLISLLSATLPVILSQLWLHSFKVFDGAADTYVLDAEMATKLKKNNPEAFRNLVKRMLEAKGRGFWSPSDDVISKLQDMFEEVEDQIEGVWEEGGNRKEQRGGEWNP